MTLRMERVAAQLGPVIARALLEREAAERGLEAAGEALERWDSDPEKGDALIEAAMTNRPEPYALSFGEPLLGTFPPGQLGPVTVVAADGSAIAPDRYAPVHCYVVNIGRAILPYGTKAVAELSSTPLTGPTLDPASLDIPATAVNLLRDVMELERGVESAREASAFGQAVLIMDGTLLPWDLDSPAIPVALAAALRSRTKDALDTLAALGPLVSAGAYVSASRSSDVVNSLRCLEPLPQDAWPALDAMLFARLLGEGERSALFKAQSARRARIEEAFPEHDVCFFYVRAGSDVARVELPHWAANRERVDRLHAAIVDQCRRCNGYPRALQEAHEQAVISMQDRHSFARLLASQAAKSGLREGFAGKQQSKRRRAV